MYAERTMSKTHIIGYTLLALLAGMSYVTTRWYLISTPLNKLIVSNLTINYLLLAFALGGATGYVAWNKMFVRLKPASRMLLTLATILCVSLIWLVGISLGGYKIR